MTIPFILTSTNVSFVLDKKPHVYSNQHVEYYKIINALKAGSEDSLRKIINLNEQLSEKSSGDITIRDGSVLYKGEPIHGTVVTRLLDMMKSGFDINPISKFIQNLMRNPSNTAVNELYLFLERGNLPITDDGHFLAYKVVTSDYKDKHTKKFDNSVGVEVKVPRNSVDDNRNNHCSNGLHFCGFEYIQSFKSEGDRIVCVKIDPADVVSIPSDYNNSKGRTCRYVVVEDITATITNDAVEPDTIKKTAQKDIAVTDIDEYVKNVVLETFDTYDIYDVVEYFDNPEQKIEEIEKTLGIDISDSLYAETVNTTVDDVIEFATLEYKRKTQPVKAPSISCPNNKNHMMAKHGFTSNNRRRYRCKDCGKNIYV